jgi:hypothetical protein
MMLQKLTIVQALVEMLRDRDFTYFTKETLFILTEDPKSRDVPAGSLALIPMLLEIFSVVKPEDATCLLQKLFFFQVYHK